MQQIGCVGRLIPLSEWDEREYPHDLDVNKIVGEMLLRSTGFPRSILPHTHSILRGIIKFFMACDLAKPSSEVLTLEMMQELVEGAWKAEKFIDIKRRETQIVN